MKLSEFLTIGDDTASSAHNPKVHATDADSGENHVIHYSLVSSVAGFSINKSTGVISVNRTAISKELLYKVSEDSFEIIYLNETKYT